MPTVGRKGLFLFSILSCDTISFFLAYFLIFWFGPNICFSMMDSVEWRHFEFQCVLLAENYSSGLRNVAISSHNKFLWSDGADEIIWFMLSLQDLNEKETYKWNNPHCRSIFLLWCCLFSCQRTWFPVVQGEFFVWEKHCMLNVRTFWKVCDESN